MNMLRRLQAPGVHTRVLVDKPVRRPPDEALCAAIYAMTRAWRAPYGSDITHVLVLEDDAILPRHAGFAMLRVLKAHPDVAVNFFCGYGYAKAAAEHGYRYARWTRHSGGVAQCLPVAMASIFNQWHMRCPPKQPLDSRMNAWLEFLRSSGEFPADVIYPAPSIVDHNGALRSVAGSLSNLYAPSAIGPERSALEYDWSDDRIYECTRVDRGKVTREPSWRS
jgi:hypothetical protein